MSELQGIRSSLTEEEKSGLKKTAKGTGAIAILMVAVVGVFGWFSAAMLTGFMVWIMMAFLLFFLAILVFIVYVRIKQAGSSEKIVYTGIVAEKKSETSQMRNSSLNETHTVRIDNEWFHVDLNLFAQLHQGEKVALHTVGNKQVFKVETLVKDISESTFEHHRERTAIYSNAFSEPTTNEEKSILNKRLFLALIFRTLLGYFIFRIVYFGCIFILVFVNLELEGGHIAYGIFAIRTGLWAIYLWVNLKTIRLLIDRFTGNTYVEIEQVTDKQVSNSRKPSPTSVVTTRNHNNYNPEYFYIQTTNYWIGISKELYDSLETGNSVEIKRSKLAKAQLAIKKASKLNYR